MGSTEKFEFDVVSDWYQSGYQEAYHFGFVGWAYQRIYKFMEKPHRASPQCTILEVGAGSGDFRAHAGPNFRRYVELDLRENLHSEQAPGVESVTGNAEDLTCFRDGEFDRLIATCVLVHLDSPVQALLEWRRVVKPGGSLSIYVPPEAGLLIRWVRRLVTWRAPSAAGLDARRIASLQHKFSYFYDESIIQEVFKGDQVKRRTFPFKLFEFDLALFHVFEITRETEEQST